MSPREEVVDFTMQDSVEKLLTDGIFDDGHCMDSTAREELRKLPGNDVCIDCGKPDPDWASVNLGIFMCLECSGQHRALGTHISFIRSVKMDSWSEDQLHLMFLGGNRKCTDFLMKQGMKSLELNKKNGINERPRPFHCQTIKERYDCAATLLYQQVLRAKRDGKPIPKQLPDYTPTPVVVTKPVVKMMGIGNTTTPSQQQLLRPNPVQSAMTLLKKFTKQ